MTGLITISPARIWITGVLLSLLLLSVQAIARPMIYAAYMAPPHPFYKAALQPLIGDIQADPDIPFDIRVIPGGQLLAARESLEGVKYRLADFTFVVPTNNRTELTHINLLFQFIAFGDNVVAGTGAVLEAMYLHCPQCLRNYTANNTVPLATGSGGQNRLFCRDPAQSVSDIRGRTIRAVGSVARLVHMMDATPINLPANEGVTAIQRGTLDCLIGPLTWMESFGYADTAPHVINVPLGYPKGLGLVIMNKTRWQSLPTATRAALLSHMGEVSARSTLDAYLNPDEDVLARADELGLTVTGGDGSFERLFRDFGEGEVAEVVKAAEASGVDDAGELLAAIRSLYPKWQGIAATTGNDPAKVGAAYQREIYDKLDPNEFGMH